MRQSFKSGFYRLGNPFKTGHFHLSTVLFFALLLIFTGYSGLVARKLNGGILPDEGTHTVLSRLFSTAWGIPPDTPETYSLGNIAQRPFLYYWINGRVINLVSLFFPSLSYWKALIVLRLWNILYGVLTVIFAYLLAREVIENHWWRLLVVFALTNTLMFVFLSGGVNYDNLANLSCFASLYFLVRVFKGKSFYPNSLAWMTWLLVGALAKFTVLPLAPVMGFTWILFIIKNRHRIQFRPAVDWKLASLAVLLVGMAVLNFSIYGVNLLKYKSLNPACEKVLTEKQCLQNALVRRARNSVPPEKRTYLDILRGNVPNPAAWLVNYWFPTMTNGTFGITGHKSLPPTLSIWFYRLFAIWTLLIALLSRKKPSFIIGSLILILIFYILVLLRTNYKGELDTDFRHYGIQGRYIFPVIGIIYVLIAYYFSSVPIKALSYASAALTLALFFWGGPLITGFAKTQATLPQTAIQTRQRMSEIAGGVELSQDFNLKCSGTIDEIRLMLLTYNRTNTHPVTIRMSDLTLHRDLMVHTIPGETIEDGVWRSFSMPPFLVSPDTIYRVTLTSPESLPGNAITVLGTEVDLYPNSEAMVNGKPTGLDLALRYQCTQSVFAGWFN